MEKEQKHWKQNGKGPISNLERKKWGLCHFITKLRKYVVKGRQWDFLSFSAVTPPPPQAATSVSILYTIEVIKTHHTVFLVHHTTVRAGAGGWAHNLSHVFHGNME
jgi:hypothetical protein